MRGKAEYFGRLPFEVFLLAFCVLPTVLPTTGRAKENPVVAKWGRFEQSFKSSVAYANALRDATVSVVFTSPSGEKRSVNGFWDGGKTWRVRFSPNEIGRWTFRSSCSDAANKGLHDQAGDFTCTAATGQSRFDQHGPIVTARGNRHFEHADGTPFLWLSDTVWSGARVSEPRDWEFYARTRLAQHFTVALWAVGPGTDVKGERALTKTPGGLSVNPAVFERLDAKLETLSRAGILNAIAPLLELKPDEPNAPPLPEDQAVLLLRYVVARWGAEPVAWVLAFEGDSQTKVVGRWKRIGQAVFAGAAHAPVVLYPGGAPGLVDEFRDQAWVDAAGYQPITDFTDDALKLAFAAPFTKAWTSQPTRPLIVFAPPENSVGPQSRKRLGADEVRKAVYWGLLLAPPAGVGYAAESVANWETTGRANRVEAKGKSEEKLPLWQKSLFLPAAKQMASVTSLVNTVDCRRLQPASRFVATQPGASSPHRYVAVAATDAKDLCLIYVPEDRTLDLQLDALPTSPTITWLNPRTGENSPAVAVLGNTSCQFPTPDVGDWLLIVRGGK